MGDAECSVYAMAVQKKQTPAETASPKPAADSVKSPPSQKAEKKTKTVMPSLLFTRIDIFKICSFSRQMENLFKEPYTLSL